MGEPSSNDSDSRSVDNSRDWAREIGSSLSVDQPGSEHFQLKRIEATLLENGLRQKLNAWSNSWIEGQNNLEQTSKEAQRRLHESGKADLTMWIEAMTTSVERMIRTIDYEILKNGKNLNSTEAISVVETSIIQEKTQALAQEEDAHNVEKRLFQPLKKMEPKTFTPSWSDLPEAVLRIGRDTRLTAGLFRGFESQTGAVPKERLMVELPSVMHRAWTDYQQQSNRKGGRPAKRSKKSPTSKMEDGLEPPPPIPNPDFNNEPRKPGKYTDEDLYGTW